MQWFYTGTNAGGIEEVHGYHGCTSHRPRCSDAPDYDILGLWMSWQYGIARDALTSSVMTRLANQMQVRVRLFDESDDVQNAIWQPKWSASTVARSRADRRRQVLGPHQRPVWSVVDWVLRLTVSDFCDGSKTPVGYL